MRCAYRAEQRAVRQLFAMGDILRAHRMRRLLCLPKPENLSALISNTIRFALNPHLACPLPAQERTASLPVSQNAAESAAVSALSLCRTFG